MIYGIGGASDGNKATTRSSALGKQAPPIHQLGEMMNNAPPLTEFFYEADEIVGRSDDISELNASRNSHLLFGVFQDFEQAFTAATQPNR